MGTVPQCAFGQIINKTDSIELSKRDSSILRKLGFRIYREFGSGSENTGDTIGLMWPEGPQCIHYFVGQEEWCPQCTKHWDTLTANVFVWERGDMDIYYSDQKYNGKYFVIIRDYCLNTIYRIENEGIDRMMHQIIPVGEFVIGY